MISQEDLDLDVAIHIERRDGLACLECCGRGWVVWPGPAVQGRRDCPRCLGAGWEPAK
jgi:hypothetical protein